MNASAMIPVMISVIPASSSPFGSLFFLIFWRIPAIAEIASVHPEPRSESECERLDEIIITNDHKQAHSEHGTVYGDQRKKDPQRIIERRKISVHQHFDQLYESGDRDDEHDETEVFEPKWHEDPIIDKIIDDRRKGDDKGYGNPQAISGLYFLGNGNK